MPSICLLPAFSENIKIKKKEDRYQRLISEISTIRKTYSSIL
jgi:hypothetical protein